MRLLASFDRYPDSVCLNLEPIASDAREFELYLTLHLQSHSLPLLDGKITWGLKGGILDAVAGGCSIAPIGGERLDFRVSRVEVPDGYRWRLALKSPGTIFTGSIERIKLGSIEVKEEPYHLLARFSATPADISIVETEKLWRHDISPNKHAILERKLAFFLVETRLNPYLSYLSLGSGDVEIDKTATEPKDEEPAILARLKEDIERVYTADTDNFLELARWMDLDPLVDLAGADLLATELSGVSLGGADLDRVNFRGANLTDADLSESIAVHANFKGADLSGALLGNADLKYADFYRASLALSNLIGSDLEGANLVEANLSRANLSGARVFGARFGDNEGMTDELRESLLDRGAVFE
ncbi:pentapeptide repeat-containing protein [Pannus brasiliensis CCIBt3594]|uniref:Pentapeptide repeat-containing protein n=1 Tax=Pannus brasiliensis CCIBt3594 TaxID=1427578 RepID=A0AAW9QZP9_9CHRO